LQSRVREYRLARHWSQSELAHRSGLSRAGVSAIEIGRLVPSTIAALALARSLDCRVEDLFSMPGAPHAWHWAWPPMNRPSRVYLAEVGGCRLCFPAESCDQGVFAHDGVWDGAMLQETRQGDPHRTLVIACCDPAAGLLAAELQRLHGVRLVLISRSSRKAVELLQQHLVHVAGLHLASHGREQNAAVVRRVLGREYMLLHGARWDEGLAIAPQRGIKSVRAALRSRLRWIGREPGSGARQCLDEILGRQSAPRRIANDHRGVAEAIRMGFADAGVCLRFSSEQSNLDFVSIREENYDLCFSAADQADPRIQALIDVVRSPNYRKLIGELPGYSNRDTGSMRSAN
jgi:molybdate-binding protein/DNA-binding XRE family transcriptional regulator